MELFLEKMAWLQVEFAGNTVRSYLAAFIFVLGLVAFIKLYTLKLGARFRRLAVRTPSPYDDCLIDALDRTVTPILGALAFYIFTHALRLPPILPRASEILLILVVVYYAISSLLRFLDVFVAEVSKDREGKRLDVHTLHNVRLLVRILFWAVGLLVVLRNFGFDVTSILAGMGIAGIAVALAVQNILGDLFSYFSILVDRPFELGDFIIIGKDMGTVEYIGVRSTRLRTLEGQELVVANADLTSARINNYRKMERRRIITRIGVEYGTPVEKLKAIPGWIEAILRGVPGVAFDRVHFASLGASSLDFEYCYFIEGAHYEDYMARQQALNYAIYEKILSEGVIFAFPTQKVHVVQRDV